MSALVFREFNSSGKGDLYDGKDIVAAWLSRENAEKIIDALMRVDSSTEKPIPYAERRYPTRQDMRLEIARLTKELEKRAVGSVLAEDWILSKIKTVLRRAGGA